jgi:penicillin-binding protein 1A
MVSIRILQAVGPQEAQNWISRFGFEAATPPAYLTMALGAGSVTPLQVALGYSVFANGGYLVKPYLITKVTDPLGKVLSQYTPIELDESLARHRAAQCVCDEPACCKKSPAQAQPFVLSRC